MRPPFLASTALNLLLALPLFADGPKDNLPDQRSARLVMGKESGTG